MSRAVLVLQATPKRFCGGKKCGAFADVVVSHLRQSSADERSCFVPESHGRQTYICLYVLDGKGFYASGVNDGGSRYPVLVRDVVSAVVVASANTIERGLRAGAGPFDVKLLRDRTTIFYLNAAGKGSQLYRTGGALSSKK